ncbi:MAG: DAK2 domain-containing protein, partial [Spirochaetota bacterium]|nr:DAK2 domain-containing protein [Spirochaetota bacterium]
MLELDKINHQALSAKIYIDIIDLTVKKTEENLSKLNALNIFPVADGDTGTNILLTLRGGQNAIHQMKTTNINELVHSFSQALIQHSRGNSGLILARYFMGFSNPIIKSSHFDL